MEIAVGNQLDRGFVSLISSKPVTQTLLPLVPEALTNPYDETFNLITRGGKFQVERSQVEAEKARRDNMKQ